VTIYPDLNNLPENLLKIYVRFSGPMGEQYSEDFITVTDGEGDTLELVFLPLQPELWNRTHDVLTLWLDPGRIKRQLGPNRLLGTPLVAGEQYTIQLSSDWRDRRGLPLIAPYHKIISAGPADRDKPNLNQWKLVAPEVGTKKKLKIVFDESMDHFLASESIVVEKESTQIEGRVEIENGQKVLSFVPQKPWTSGTHHLRVESRLEDLAGNNLNRLFDEVITEGNDEPEPEFHYLNFTIE
jgi:hypothetical protein